MKKSGIVRNVDNLGRVVLPKEIRKVLSISEGDPVEISQENNQIVVKKYYKGCIFCGMENEVTEFKGISICGGCIKELV
ncbi:AbrB/MazE/SpoVT family DNA-binding domain-containing protein [Clostridium sp. C2-6-12]|uniref:AbrB/MazE/SpoVT family DNA-binding domain-containing protein n=1 Tax=Clostridium sp. C2-6-12 TaxID=2698832 RepID=UPI001372110B|nr:AbrB/MazE/SpoVT family DNA-binding domain-containing protein [Clostridium sp. C2-6-12]